jgi:hypothetical protein
MRLWMLVAAVAALCLTGRAAAAGAEVDLTRAEIVLGAGADRLEALAARELQRYLGLMGAGRCRIVPQAQGAGPRLVLGTPRSSSDVARLVAATKTVGSLGDEGYLLHTRPGRVTLAAATPRGVLWAVYGLLERLGVGFYLGGDALAGAGPARLPVGLTLLERPALKVRGSLPWYNFLNSPTTWDRDDFRFFFDQMARMRMNFVGFHSYDSEPFCAYEFGGKLIGGEPLVTAHDYGWGTMEGLATRDFGFGTGEMFNGPEFGSKPATQPGSREQQIRRQQALLAEGLTYARSRGLHVCVGFEVMGDPTHPDAQARLEARLTALMKAYPMLDTVWIWQSEGLGGGSDIAAPGSPMELAVARHGGAFAYLESPARIHEAVRVMLYSRLAHGILRRLAPKVRMAVSGWGGDKWMRFSDFYLGLDKMLPPDVIFAALDNIDPSMATTVADAYGKLSPGRERWPIPWWESDGGYSRRDQWGPQTNAAPFLHLCRDVLRKGCQGMLAIHWRSRDVEEAAALQARFAWDTSLTYEGFFDRFARACYGPNWAAEMSSIHRELEALGPRWTGAPGQVECGGFEWFSEGRLPLPGNLAKLAALSSRIDRVRRGMVAGGETAGLERIDWLLATIDWLGTYDEAAVALRPRGPVDTALNRAEEAKRTGDAAACASAAAEAGAAFRAAPLGRAMKAFARKISTRGEWGALATINVKAYAAYRRIVVRLRAVGGDPGPEERALPASVVARIQMQTPAGLVEPRKSVAVEAVLLGNTAGLRVRYRPAGVGTWRTAPMSNSFARTWTGVIPASAVDVHGIEYVVEAVDGAGRAVATSQVWTASAVTIPDVRPFALAGSRKPAPVRNLTATAAPDYEVRLAWEAATPGAMCEVTRTPPWQGGATVRTALGELCDVQTVAGVALRYEVAEVVGGKRGSMATASVTVPTLAPRSAPGGLEARAGAGKVRLTWAPVQGRVRGYRVYRSEAGGEAVCITPEPIAAPLILDTRVTAQREYAYTVSVVDRGGREGERSEPVRAVALERPSGPVFEARLTGQAPGGTLQPPAVLTDEGLQTQSGGWVAYANRPDFALEGEFSVSMRFKAASVDAIPVLASCGEFAKQGWFVQILAQGLRFSLGGENVMDAGRIEAGRWYHVACTYDGARMRVFIDGKEAGSRPAPVIDFRPWPGPLYVGHYHLREEMYQFRGLLRDLRLYAFALTPEEVAAEAGR